MSKAVLISIQPKWCELILLGKKTIEARKSRPKLETPFKCYIYQSKGRDRLIEVMKDGDENYGEIYHGKPVFIKTMGYRSGYKGLFGNEQKVVGEFICDTIVTDLTFGHDPLFNGAACMSEVDAAVYSCQSPIYGWHISSLAIYGKPKELSELRAVCRHYDDGLCGDCEYYDYANNESYRYEECAVDGLKPITRPPQSWCYVKEREDNA